MSMKKQENDDEQDNIAEHIKQEIDNYEQTILALQAITSHLKWDDHAGTTIKDSKHSIGRRMEASSTTVTPDAVVQRTNDLGYVIEAKVSIPRNTNDQWNSVVDQIKKYNQDLIGWWTGDEKISIHCVILLLEIHRTAAFRNYLTMRTSNEATQPVVFEKPTSLIEFSPLQNGDIFLRMVWGNILDGDEHAKLSDGFSVPMEKVVVKAGSQKFYDSCPPVERTMIVLWQDLFNGMSYQLKSKSRDNNKHLRVTVMQLCTDLQKLHGSIGNQDREVEFPTQTWVKEALDKFVILGLAEAGSQNGEYVILFRRLRVNDLVEYFSSWRIKHDTGKTQNAKQLSFFNEHDENDLQ